MMPATTRSTEREPLAAGRRPPLRVVALACAFAGTLACGERPPVSRDDATPPPASTSRAAPATPAAPPTDAPVLGPPRHPLPGRVVRWTRGGSERDTLLAYPRQAVADAHNLYILDAGRGQIVALRTSDGTVAWQRANTPAPHAIAAVPGGGIAVADGDGRTISLLDSAGRPVATRALPTGTPAIRSLCALAPTHLVAATADTSHALLELRDDPPPPAGRGDAPPRPLPLPWPDLAGRHYLTTQTWLAGATDDSRCVVALALGRGFALYDGARFSPPARYVEPFDLPGITRTRFTDGDRTVTREQLSSDRAAARIVALAAGRVFVSFAGESTLNGRLVDVHDARSGAYVGTSTLPHRASALAAHGRDIYIVYQRHGRPAVAALADTAASPTPRPQQPR